MNTRSAGEVIAGLSGWNYRLVVTAEKDDDRDITVCEVYYDEAGEPKGYVDSAPPSGSTPMEALSAHERMRGAFEQPVLRLDENGRMVEVSEETERSWDR